MRIRFSLKIKMALLALALSSFVALVSYIGTQAITSAHNDYKNIVQTELPAITALSELRKQSVGIHLATLAYQDDLKYNLTDPKSSADHRNQLLTALNDISAAESKYLQADAAAAKAEHVQQSSSNKSLTAARQAMATNILELINLRDSNAPLATLTAKMDDIEAKQATLTSVLDTALENKKQAIIRNGGSAEQRTANVSRSSYMVVLITLLSAIGISMWIATIVSSRIRKLEEGTAHIAAGDFSYKVMVKGNDELGKLADSFNQMSNRFQDSYRRLAFAKQRDEALIESMSEGLIAVDETGKIVLLNKVAADLFALPDREGATGKALSEVAKIYDQKKHLVHHAQHPAYQTLKEAHSTTGVYSYKAPEGFRLLNVSSSPVVLEGKVAGAIVVLRDVTKEKEVDRMKTEFISLASHQLRTPLSAIKWFSEMLLNGDAGKMSAEQTDFTKNIADSTERMIDLVNSLLNISRMESGRIIVEPKPTDLGELVNGIISDLKGKTEEKQQTLIVSVHKDLKKINLDPHLIGQVYMNFLTNAIKYTPQGGEVSVMISKKGDQIVSQISDNGYGIPKAQHGRVFEKFFRAENIAKVETDGTGLGLYLVKAIIESSGGKVWFESEEGKGTTFWFTIPITGMKPREGEVSLDD